MLGDLGEKGATWWALFTGSLAVVGIAVTFLVNDIKEQATNDQWFEADKSWNASILAEQRKTNERLLAAEGKLDRILDVEQERHARANALVDRLEQLRRDLEYSYLIGDRHP